MSTIVKALANLPTLTEGQPGDLYVDVNGKLHVAGGGGSADSTAALQTSGNAILTAISGKLPAALGPTTPALSISTIQAASTSIVTGQHAVTTAASQLASTATYKNGVKLTNLSTSASPLFYGPSGVTATTGDELPAGQSVVLPVNDPSLIYVITASSTATASFAGLP